MILLFTEIKIEIIYIVNILIMDYLNLLQKLNKHNVKDCIEEDIPFDKENKNKKDLEIKCIGCNKIGTIIFDYNYSKTVCKNCGTTNDDIVDDTADWRFYGATDNKASDPTRCGGPINPLLPKSSMGTTISSSNNPKYKNIQRIQQWNQMPADERSLYEVFKKIDLIKRDSSINSKIINECKIYYKRLSEKEEDKKSNIGVLTRGSIRKGLIAACLYNACKNNNFPMRELDIAKICNITKNEMTRGLNKFNKLEQNKQICIKNDINNIHLFINKYSRELDIPENLIKIIHLIYIRAKKLYLLKNSNNISICSGLLYFIIDSFNLNIKKSEVIKTVKISEVTLNKIYKEFLSHKKYIFIGFEKIGYKI